MTLRRGRLTRSQVAALPRITEASFQAQIVQLAKMLGWWVYHPMLSKWSERGWPDLTLIRDRHLIFAEIKRDNGKLTPHQTDVLDRLRAIEMSPLSNSWPTIQVFVWRPSDFDEITAVLR